MIEIIDITERVFDGRAPEYDFELFEGIAVHRCGVDLQTGAVLGYDAASVSDAFTGKNPEWKEVARATGNQNAYSLLVGGDLGPEEYNGKIWQLMPLDEVGAHARRFSKKFIGVGVIADPRIQAPSLLQWNHLVDLLSEICAAYAWDPRAKIWGHGEIKGAHDGSKAPGKPAACPGDLLDMNSLRHDVAAVLMEKARRRLTDAGFSFV